MSYNLGVIAARKRQQARREMRLARADFRARTYGAATAFIAAVLVALLSSDTQFVTKSLATVMLLAALPHMVLCIMVERAMIMRGVLRDRAQLALMYLGVTLSLAGLTLIASAYSFMAGVAFLVSAIGACLLMVIALRRVAQRGKI